MKMIALINANQATKIDQAVHDALFLRRNPQYRPEDLGYPPADYIILDLQGEIV